MRLIILLLVFICSFVLLQGCQEKKTEDFQNYINDSEHEEQDMGNRAIINAQF